MVKTIGNPLSWAAAAFGGAASHMTHAAQHIGSAEPVDDIRLNRLTTHDLRAALRAGLDDFAAARADVMFLVLLYPVLGLLLVGFGLNMNLLHLLVPLIAGFAILGPLAAVGLYEISRNREMGGDASWASALKVFSRPNFGAIMMMGFYLVALFLGWLMAAHLIALATIGPVAPTSIGDFLSMVYTTSDGWVMMILGGVVGLAFALAALAVSVISFPLLLDRDVGLPVAVSASVRLFRENPGVILTWGLIVAVGLFLGAIPALLGLVIVLPVLGHATWHLYRRAVA